MINTAGPQFNQLPLRYVDFSRQFGTFVFATAWSCLVLAFQLYFSWKAVGQMRQNSFRIFYLVGSNSTLRICLTSVMRFNALLIVLTLTFAVFNFQAIFDGTFGWPGYNRFAVDVFSWLVLNSLFAVIIRAAAMHGVQTENSLLLATAMLALLIVPVTLVYVMQDAVGSACEACLQSLPVHIYTECIVVTCITGVLYLCTNVTAFVCWRNFGNGLKEKFADKGASAQKEEELVDAVMPGK